MPAESRHHTVRLSGIAKAPGTLKIEGILVRMLGGSIEETIQQTVRCKKSEPHQNQYSTKPLEFIGVESIEIPLPFEL